MRPPTETQKKIEAFVADYQQRHGCAPTLEEIRLKFGYKSTNTVRSHLTLLAKKGRLTRLPRKARGIRLKEKPTRQTGIKTVTSRAPSGIPLIGTIPAGPMEEAMTTSDEILPLEAGLFSGDQVFALRVKGDSMKNVGILPGDFAILNSQELVSNGQIAAVQEGDDATLKRVFKRREGLLLRPENDDLEDRLIIPSEAKSVRIVGRLVGLLRVEGGRR